MNMNKRIYPVCLLIQTLVACSLQKPILTVTATPIPSKTSTPTPAQTHTPTPTPPYGCAPNCTYEDMVVGFVQVGSESGWRAANVASFRETAEELGLSLMFYDSARPNSIRIQQDSFRQFIADEEVNVIVFNAVSTSGWEGELQAAQAAGKIVIIEDRCLDVSENLYATCVGSDFVEQGRRAGRAMVELLADSEQKNVLELFGDLSSMVALDRAQGFREAIQGSGIKIVQSEEANWFREEGRIVVDDFLKESTDIQGIYGQNDEMALGAIEALKEAGLQPGIDIKIVSIDATYPAFEAMLAGELNVSVECSPLLAPQVFDAALKAMNGEELPKFIPSEEGLFSSDMPDLAEIAKDRKY